MPALREVQAAVLDVVLRRTDPATHGLALLPADARLDRRLGVYRTNARENFAAALAAAFPLLERELGAARLRGLAADYQDAHPSPSGNLFDIGRQLPAFLGAQTGGGPQEYLGDIARLEWAVQEAMVAADCADRFDPAALAAVPAAAHEALSFRLHPTVRLLATAWPVFARWQALHTAPAGTPLEQELPRRSTEHLLVRRTAGGIELQRLAAADHDLLAAIAGGSPLGDLADLVQAGAVPADLGQVLARWARAGVITGIATG